MTMKDVEKVRAYLLKLNSSIVGLSEVIEAVECGCTWRLGAGGLMVDLEVLGDICKEPLMKEAKSNLSILTTERERVLAAINVDIELEHIGTIKQ